mgnify:CR=1 FL=1
MKSSGLKPRLIAPEGPKRTQAGLAFASEIMSDANRPTAVIAYGADAGGAAFMLAARDMGLKVPKDLSVITFDDEPVRALQMPVATMTVPVYDVGTNAVSVLLKKLASPKQSLKPVVLTFGFTAGDTIAKAPKG